MRRIRIPDLPKLPKIDPHHLAVAIKVIAFTGGVFIIFMLFRISAQNHQLAQSAKDISEQNQAIAKLNGQHIDCLADLFAKYTRESRPITIDDLDQCKVTSAEAAALMSGSVDFTSLPSTTRPEPTTKTNTPTNSPTSQGATPQTSTPAPVQKQPDPPASVLGIPLCVPDPLGLINGGACLR